MMTIFSGRNKGMSAKTSQSEIGMQSQTRKQKHMLVCVFFVQQQWLKYAAVHFFFLDTEVWAGRGLFSSWSTCMEV